MSALEVDFEKVVTQICSEVEAKALPKGAVVGDTWGGRSFNDNIAAVLENRSLAGWCEVAFGSQRWTLIFLNRR